jgi:hypothetical protein
VRWGPAIHRSGVQSNTDLEPGRCRRTDGKKWRCGRDVVPDQKYCEKHVHRGRQRPRRNAVELGPHAAAAATGSSPSATSSSSGAAATAVHVSAGTTNVGPIRTSSTTSGGGTSGSSCFSLSSCLQQQQHRPSSNLSVKSCFSSSHSSPSPGSGGGSSPAGSSQFGQLPSLTSSPSAVAAASTFASKDYSRYTAFSHTRFLWSQQLSIMFFQLAVLTVISQLYPSSVDQLQKRWVQLWLIIQWVTYVFFLRTLFPVEFLTWLIAYFQHTFLQALLWWKVTVPVTRKTRPYVSGSPLGSCCDH